MSHIVTVLVVSQDPNRFHGTQQVQATRDSSTADAASRADVADHHESDGPRDNETIAYYLRDIDGHAYEPITVTKSCVLTKVYVPTMGQVVDDFFAALDFEADTIEVIYDIYTTTYICGLFWASIYGTGILQAIAKFIFCHTRIEKNRVEVHWSYHASG